MCEICLDIRLFVTIGYGKNWPGNLCISVGLPWLPKQSFKRNSVTSEYNPRFHFFPNLRFKILYRELDKFFTKPIRNRSFCSDCKEDKTAHETLRLGESNRYNTSGTLDVDALLPGADSIWSSAAPDVSAIVLLGDELKANLTNFSPTEHDATLTTMADNAAEV